MTTIRRFVCNDLFTFNAVNLDYFTETVWPDQEEDPLIDTSKNGSISRSQIVLV